MAHKSVAFTWQILTDQLETDDVNARPLFLADTANQAKNSRTTRGRHRLWWAMLGLVIVVGLGAGHRLYRSAEAGAALLEVELQEAIVLESYDTADVAVTVEPAPPVLQSFDLHDEVAAVEAVVAGASHSLPYREVRFYRQIDDGWQPCEVDLRFWGPQRQLESKHFVFRYRQRDAAAVTAAAPALDVFFAQLYRTLDRSMPNTAAKVVVKVFADPASAGRNLSGAMPDTIHVPSPALLQIPVEVSNADAIALAARISLIYRLLPRGSTDWLDTGAQPEGWWLPPLTAGLRLWLLWDGDSLPARWHHDALAPYFANSCRSCLRPSESPSGSTQAFCQTLAMLWPYSADSLSIPCLVCGDADYYTGAIWPNQQETQSRLAPLSSATDGVPLVEEPDLLQTARMLQTTYGGQVVTMMTLLEYVEIAYGREQIPVLLAAFGTYQRWDTLVPAVFGIPAEDFDAGWRAYLAEQYDGGEAGDLNPPPL